MYSKCINKSHTHKLTNTSKLIKCEYCKVEAFFKEKNYKIHLEEMHSIGTDFRSSNYDISKRKLEEQKKQLIKEKEKEKRLQIERLREEEISKNTKFVYLIWDNVKFGNNKIFFETKMMDLSLKPIPIAGITESLNFVKKDYFIRLYGKQVYKFAHYKGEVVLDKSPGWERFISTIEFAGDYLNFKYSSNVYSTRLKIFNHLSNSEILNLFESSFLKSNYLKYLANLQDKNFKIIPIREYINNHLEESFLFRIKTQKGAILTFWENVNESRATHIFVSGEDSQFLELLENFIVAQNIESKRSIFYQQDIQSKMIQQKLNYLTNIKHISMIDYEIEVLSLLKNL